MMFRLRRSMRVPVAIAALVAANGAAHASLGGDMASIQADAAALVGTVQASTILSYDVQQIDVPGGLSVREYRGSDGLVFALSWAGPAPADLQQLLGAYFAEFAAAAGGQAHSGLRRGMRVLLPDLVVQLGGHLRAYTGQAYLPRLLPAGVSPTDLR